MKSVSYLSIPLVAAAVLGIAVAEPSPNPKPLAKNARIPRDSGDITGKETK